MCVCFHQILPFYMEKCISHSALCLSFRCASGFSSQEEIQQAWQKDLEHHKKGALTSLSIGWKRNSFFLLCTWSKLLWMSIWVYISWMKISEDLFMLCLTAEEANQAAGVDCIYYWSHQTEYSRLKIKMNLLIFLLFFSGYHINIKASIFFISCLVNKFYLVFHFF